jgi:hypothetical protein
MRSRGFPLPVIAVCLAAVSLWTRQVPAGSAVAQYLSSRSLDEMKGDLSGVACDVSGHCQIVGAFAVPNPKHSPWPCFPPAMAELHGWKRRFLSVRGS